MKKTIFTCDHCGKEIDDMRDYTDMNIDNFINFIKTDLCSSCFRKLDDIVLQYCNKKDN
jgi:hypothetical protein